METKQSSNCRKSYVNFSENLITYLIVKIRAISCVRILKKTILTTTAADVLEFDDKGEFFSKIHLKQLYQVISPV